MKVPNGRAILPLSSNCRCEASQDKLPSHEHDHSTESNIYWRREIQFVIHFRVFSRALLDALSCQRPLLFHPHPPNVSAGVSRRLQYLHAVLPRYMYASAFHGEFPVFFFTLRQCYFHWQENWKSWEKFWRKNWSITMPQHDQVESLNKATKIKTKKCSKSHRKYTTVRKLHAVIQRRKLATRNPVF